MTLCSIYNMATVTIVIPTYNCGDLLERSVLSTQRITGSNPQVIIIDDGSTDHTSTTLEGLKSRVPDLHILKTDNNGPSHARNLGLKHAVGTYIIFLDADDELLPFNTQDLLAGAPDIIRVGVEVINFDGTSSFHISPSCTMSGKDYLSYGFKNNSLETMNCAYIYNLSWLKANNITYDNNIIHEDELFITQALLAAKSVCIVEVLLYRYWKRNHSLTCDNSHKKLLARIKSYCFIALRLTEIANRDPTFDLRWKIHEVLGGAHRLALHCSSMNAKIITLITFFQYMIRYRGFGNLIQHQKNWQIFFEHILRCLFFPPRKND